jgi:hypothetical protein
MGAPPLRYPLPSCNAMFPPLDFSHAIFEKYMSKPRKPRYATNMFDLPGLWAE